MKPVALLVVALAVACTNRAADVPPDAGAGAAASSSGPASSSSSQSSSLPTSASASAIGVTSFGATSLPPSSSAPSTTSSGTAEPPVVAHAFAATNDIIINPERGFYDWIDVLGNRDFSSVRGANRTLAYAGVRLDAYRDAPLDAAVLTALQDGLAAVRTSGIKVILRFTYNDCFCDDASLARILEHIGQLQPLLAANSDVIAVMQAGFIGAWGEWHSSTNGLDNPSAHHDVLEAVLAVLPALRMVQIRTPNAKSEVYGAALTADEAFTETSKARIGHHNDCFLASGTDYGTYPEPVETWKDFVAQDGLFTPVGGETCAVNPPRSECESATSEMARLHTSFMNAVYHPDVLASWAPCREEIERRLGYRIVLDRADFNESVRPGGVLDVTLTLHNEGWAAMFNPRPVYLRFDEGSAMVAVRLNWMDPRRWASGSSVTHHVRIRVPANVAPGARTMSLWLPDEQMRTDARYAVQLANVNVWDAASGTNVLTTQLHIDPQAGGESDPSSTQWAVISGL